MPDKSTIYPNAISKLYTLAPFNRIVGVICFMVIPFRKSLGRLSSQQVSFIKIYQWIIGKMSSSS